MIYTIGRVDLYERYFAEQMQPMKAPGGSVWAESIQAAFVAVLCTEFLSGGEYRVYGVRAFWDLDAEPRPVDTDDPLNVRLWRDASPHRRLTCNAVLVQLDYAVQYAGHGSEYAGDSGYRFDGKFPHRPTVRLTKEDALAAARAWELYADTIGGKARVLHIPSGTFL